MYVSVHTFPSPVPHPAFLSYSTPKNNIIMSSLSSSAKSKKSALMSTLPLAGIVPKEETNAIQFIRDNPDYDGRGITIGIMDTGIDPGAIGLQHTSCYNKNNKNENDALQQTKLVDTIDCSGSGDVLLSEAPVNATWNEDHWEVTGLTGRTLKFNPQWNVEPLPGGSSTTGQVQVRLGMKSAYELFPKRLVTR